MDLRDRKVADVFGLPHRLYRELKSQGYRWQVLAPASLQVVEDAINGHWSVEKTAEWMDATPQEAAQCLRRYKMSAEIEEAADAAARIRKAITSWLSRFEQLSKPERQALAEDLAMHIGNQLDWAARQGQDLAQLAGQLEPRDAPGWGGGDGGPSEGGSESKPSSGQAPPLWGPQWKD